MSPLIRTLVFTTCFGCHSVIAEMTPLITPTEVYQKVQVIGAEIELIRLEMGVPATTKETFMVTNAQPREVYFQALTLFKKSNRLLFEQLREKEKEPAELPADIQPNDVLNLVNRSYTLIMRVKAYLGIPETSMPTPSSEERSPSDVFELILVQNRKLNSLLQQRFSPADVYQQLTYGVGVMGAIIATLPVTNRLGVEPETERRKTPTDVYSRLLETFGRLCSVMGELDESCLRIDSAELKRPDVTPSDVYDLASLVVSEMLYLHSLHGEAATPKASYYPGEKLPSHVYQRAGRLLSQIALLEKYTLADSDWLKPR